MCEDGTRLRAGMGRGARVHGISVRRRQGAVTRTRIAATEQIAAVHADVAADDGDGGRVEVWAWRAGKGRMWQGGGRGHAVGQLRAGSTERTDDHLQGFACAQHSPRNEFFGIVCLKSSTHVVRFGFVYASWNCSIYAAVG